MPYILYHALTGNRIWISSEKNNFYHVGVWKNKHSIRWMLIEAVNEYNDNIDGKHNYGTEFTGGQPVTLSEFIVVKVTKEQLANLT